MNQMPKTTTIKPPWLFDRWLLLAVFGLLALGLLMVTSASMVISERQFGTPFHYVIRQVSYLGLGALIGFVVLRIDSKFWVKVSGYVLLFSLLMLVAVLIPGVGRVVNGSSRWLGIGSFGFQVSELAKFAVILYLAGYLQRREQEVKTRISGFFKPMILLTIISALLLLQPDFGTTVVIMAAALGMLFLAGVPLRYFIILVAIVSIGMIGLAISSPYRLARLTTFLNPWANQYDSGYQLTQSLIAFGRGSWFGVGLGDSLQKLFYLPEAHTDFLFAVLAEELGLLGELLVIGLFVLFIARVFSIGRRAQHLDKPFSAYLAYGLGLSIGLQAMINIGVNSGVLPTKGLTLPFMSYGGSSLLMMCISVAILLRLDHESRINKQGLH